MEAIPLAQNKCSRSAKLPRESAHALPVHLLSPRR